MCFGAHVKYRYYGQILMKLEFSPQIFEKKNFIIKYHENRFIGSRFFSVRMDGRAGRS